MRSERQTDAGRHTNARAVALAEVRIVVFFPFCHFVQNEI